MGIKDDSLITNRQMTDTVRLCDQVAERVTGASVHYNIGGDADPGRLEAMLYSPLWVEISVELRTVESGSTERLAEEA